MGHSLRSSTLVPRGFIVDNTAIDDDVMLIAVRPTSKASFCPICGTGSERIHSRYQRRLADLPLVGKPVRLVIEARRFHCDALLCGRRIFAERFDGDILAPSARRTARLDHIVHHLGLALGGRPAATFAKRLMLPVSNDTLLRVVRRRGSPRFVPPTVIGIDDWAWRRNQRYGTIICDLERGRILELLPDRDADTVAAWLKRHPGIEIIARDRAGLYANGARRGAPAATQVADRWHLLNSLSEALRLAVSRQRKAVQAAGRAWSAEIGNAREVTGSQSDAHPARDSLRRLRREERGDRFQEIVRLRQVGPAPRQIAPRIGMSVRTVERWLAAGGEPEHRRPPARRTCINPFRDYLEQRLRDGAQNGAFLWAEIRQHGFDGSRATLYRWLATRRQRPASEAVTPRC